MHIVFQCFFSSSLDFNSYWPLVFKNIISFRSDEDNILDILININKLKFFPSLFLHT